MEVSNTDDTRDDGVDAKTAACGTIRARTWFRHVHFFPRHLCPPRDPQPVHTNYRPSPSLSPELSRSHPVRGVARGAPPETQAPRRRGTRPPSSAAAGVSTRTWPAAGRGGGRGGGSSHVWEPEAPSKVGRKGKLRAQVARRARRRAARVAGLARLVGPPGGRAAEHQAGGGGEEDEELRLDGHCRRASRVTGERRGSRGGGMGGPEMARPTGTRRRSVAGQAGD